MSRQLQEERLDNVFTLVLYLRQVTKVLTKTIKENEDEDVDVADIIKRELQKNYYGHQQNKNNNTNNDDTTNNSSKSPKKHVKNVSKDLSSLNPDTLDIHAADSKKETTKIKGDRSYQDDSLNVQFIARRIKMDEKSNNDDNIDLEFLHTMTDMITYIPSTLSPTSVRLLGLKNEILSTTKNQVKKQMEAAKAETKERARFQWKHIMDQNIFNKFMSNQSGVNRDFDEIEMEAFKKYLIKNYPSQYDENYVKLMKLKQFKKKANESFSTPPSHKKPRIDIENDNDANSD